MDAIIKAVNEHKKAVLKIYERDLSRAVRYANSELYKELNNMYDSYIKQYYLYKTKYYIRHWEGRAGTMSGTNLYYGKDITYKQTGRNPSLSIYFPGDANYKNEMHGGYEYDTPDDVLLNVFRGYRGIKGYWIDEWDGHYEGKYFYFSGIMKNAFDTFINYFDDISSEIITNELRKMGYN